jgi:hypothetical protein
VRFQEGYRTTPRYRVRVVESRNAPREDSRYPASILAVSRMCYPDRLTQKNTSFLLSPDRGKPVRLALGNHLITCPACLWLLNVALYDFEDP